MKLNTGNQGISLHFDSPLAVRPQEYAALLQLSPVPLPRRAELRGTQGSSSSLPDSLLRHFAARFLVARHDRAVRRRTQSLGTRNERFAEIDFEEFRYVFERSEVAPTIHGISLGS